MVDGRVFLSIFGHFVLQFTAYRKTSPCLWAVFYHFFGHFVLQFAMDYDACVFLHQFLQAFHGVGGGWGGWGVGWGGGVLTSIELATYVMRDH